MILHLSFQEKRIMFEMEVVMITMVRQRMTILMGELRKI
jgi:hypothetical protein